VLVFAVDPEGQLVVPGFPIVFHIQRIDEFVELPLQPVGYAKRIGENRRHVTMVDILAVFLPEIVLKTQLRLQVVCAEVENIPAYGLNMIHLLARHQDIPWGSVVPIGIYPPGFQAVRIGKETGFAVGITEVKDGMEPLAKIPSGQVNVGFAPRCIPQALLMECHAIVIYVYRIRRDAVIAVAQVGSPCIREPSVRPAAYAYGRTVASDVAPADKVN